MQLQERLREENYWKWYSMNCRSNEKHLNRTFNSTLKWKPNFGENRQMQMIQILRFLCHHFLGHNFPIFPQFLSQGASSKEKAIWGNWSDYQPAKLYQINWLKPDYMKTFPSNPIRSLQISDQKTGWQGKQMLRDTFLGQWYLSSKQASSFDTYTLCQEGIMPRMD